MKANRRAFIAACASTLAAISPAGWPARAASRFDEELVRRARADGTVSLYTSLDTKIVDSILAAFEQRFGLKVDYYRGTPAEVTARVMQETMAGVVRADLVDVSDVPALLEMKRRNLLIPYESPFAKHVSADAKDAGHMWTGCRLTHAVIQWNTAAHVAPPRSWRDLVDPKWQGKLAMFADPGGSEVARLWTAAESVGWDTLRGIGKNQPLLAPTTQTLSQLVEQQERPVAFNQNDNVAARSKLQGRPTDFLFPTDCVPTEVGAVALLKGSAHPNAAALLLDWWLSDEGQRLLVAGGKVSSRSDMPMPEGYPSLAGLHTRIIDSRKFEEHRSAIDEQVREIFNRTG